MVREDMGKRMDELARKYAETHDPKVKEELERLSWELAATKIDDQAAFFMPTSFVTKLITHTVIAKRIFLRQKGKQIRRGENG
jgi:hypothetical protein